MTHQTCSPGICVLGLSSLIFITGCGGSERTPTAQVDGTVTFDGTPVAAGTITFETSGSRPASGRIKDGQIVDVMTYEPGDGVPVGSHKIAVSATSVSEAQSAVVSDPGQTQDFDPNYMGGGESLVPDKYTDPELSGLTAEVKAGETNTITIELKSQ